MTALTGVFCLLAAVGADDVDAARLVAGTCVERDLTVKAHVHDPPSGQERLARIKVVSVAVTGLAGDARVVWARQEHNALVSDFSTGTCKSSPDPWNFKHFRFYPLDRDHVIFSFVSYGGVKVFKVDLKDRVDLQRVWEGGWSFPGELWLNNSYHIPVYHLLRKSDPESPVLLPYTMPKIAAVTLNDGLWRVTLDWNDHIVSLTRPDDGLKWKLEEVRPKQETDLCLPAAVDDDNDDGRLVARTTAKCALTVEAHVHNPPSGRKALADRRLVSVAVTHLSGEPRVVWARQERDGSEHDPVTGQTFLNPWNFKHYRFDPLDRDHVIFSYVSWGGIRVFNVDLRNSVDLPSAWEEGGRLRSLASKNDVHQIPVHKVLRESDPASQLLQQNAMPKIVGVTLHDGLWRVTLNWQDQVLSFTRPDDGPKWKLEEVKPDHGGRHYHGRLEQRLRR